MAVASLVLGIISIIFAFIPCTSWIGIITAIIGLVLGIIDLVKKKKAGEKKGMSIAGTVCSGIAVVIVAGWIILGSYFTGKLVNTFNNSISDTDWNVVANEWAAELENIDFNTYME